jgi:hypothetical protein
MATSEDGKVQKKIGLLFIVAAIMALTACPTGAVPPTYSRIIVDTYFSDETLATQFNTGFTILDLYVVSGGSLQPVASDPSGSSPDLYNPQFAYIDYNPATALTSGTVLYIRITAASAFGDYAIRVLDAPDPDVTAGNQRKSSWYFGTATSTDSSYEPDDFPGAPPAVPSPAAKITVGGKLHRSLSSLSDVDWVKLTLP